MISDDCRGSIIGVNIVRTQILAVVGFSIYFSLKDYTTEDDCCPASPLANLFQHSNFPSGQLGSVLLANAEKEREERYEQETTPADYKPWDEEKVCDHSEQV